MYVCVNYDVLYVMIDHTLYLVITVNCLFAENVQQIINELSKKYRLTSSRLQLLDHSTWPIGQL